MKSIFTQAQRTEKKYPMSLAISQAKSVLRDKNPRLRMCTNAVPKHRDYGRLMTLEEISEITEQLIDDSFYYYVLSE